MPNIAEGSNRSPVTMTTSLMQGDSVDRFRTKIEQEQQQGSATIESKLADIAIPFLSGVGTAGILWIVQIVMYIYDYCNQENVKNELEDIVAGYKNLQEGICEQFEKLSAEELRNKGRINIMFRFNRQDCICTMQKVKHNDTIAIQVFLTIDGISKPPITLEGKTNFEELWKDINPAGLQLTEPLEGVKQRYEKAVGEFDFLTPEKPVTQLIKSMTDDELNNQLRSIRLFHGDQTAEEAKEVAFKRGFVDVRDEKHLLALVDKSKGGPLKQIKEKNKLDTEQLEKKCSDLIKDSIKTSNRHLNKVQDEYNRQQARIRIENLTLETSLERQCQSKLFKGNVQIQKELATVRDNDLRGVEMFEKKAAAFLEKIKDSNSAAISKLKEDNQAKLTNIQNELKTNIGRHNQNHLAYVEMVEQTYKTTLAEINNNYLAQSQLIKDRLLEKVKGHIDAMTPGDPTLREDRIVHNSPIKPVAILQKTTMLVGDVNNNRVVTPYVISVAASASYDSQNGFNIQEYEKNYDVLGEYIIDAAKACAAERIILSDYGVGVSSMHPIRVVDEVNAEQIAITSMVKTIRELRRLGKEVVFYVDRDLDIDGFWSEVDKKLESNLKCKHIDKQEFLKKTDGIGDTDMFVGGSNPYFLGGNPFDGAFGGELANRSTLHLTNAVACSEFAKSIAPREHKYESLDDLLRENSNSFSKRDQLHVGASPIHNPQWQNESINGTPRQYESLNPEDLEEI